MPKGFIMMTALPPTKGHEALIRFAQEYGKSYGLSHIVVLICGQPHEPYPVAERVFDLAQAFNETDLMRMPVQFLSLDIEMPQQPEDHKDFWGLWQSVIYDRVGIFADDDIVFSSEPYGYALAKVLMCRHVPYDMARDVTHAKASHIRRDPVKYWYSLSEGAARRFQKTVTIFGAESTGKTTMAKYLAEAYNSRWLPEWARPYLESLDSPETTDERMEVIVHGQRALEQSAKKLPQTPFVFRDTDLLSTVGYYRIYSSNPPVVAVDKADLYIVMSSDIPFTPDPLRYGGDRRESSDKFWMDLLNEYKVDWTYPRTGDKELRELFAESSCNHLLKTIPWVGFERKGNK